MNLELHLLTMMSKEDADLFQSEILKSLNYITLNSQRKISRVRKYGNTIVVTLDTDKKGRKEAYTFELCSKMPTATID